jgi:hypothetical protein
MPRRKKGFGFNQFIIMAVLVVGTWIAADWYFNVYRSSLAKNSAGAPAPAAPGPAAIPAAGEEAAPALEDGFRLETYRDADNGFEFQYPVYSQNDPGCPSLVERSDGFDLGQFSLTTSPAAGELTDFIAGQLEGMEMGESQSVAIAGLAATKVDYQTKGMGFNGSDVYIEHAGKFYDFGILANTSATTCGGVDDYADRVYRSVITTLKFTD